MTLTLKIGEGYIADYGKQLVARFKEVITSADVTSKVKIEAFVEGTQEIDTVLFDAYRTVGLEALMIAMVQHYVDDFETCREEMEDLS